MALDKYVFFNSLIISHLVENRVINPIHISIIEETLINQFGEKGNIISLISKQMKMQIFGLFPYHINMFFI